MIHKLKLGLKLLCYPFYVAGIDLHEMAFNFGSTPHANSEPPSGVSQITPMSDTCNFRDIGGIRTTDGKTIKEGLLFRSDHLDFVDEKQLQALGIKTIIDFRSSTEKKSQSKKSTIKTISLPVFKGSEVSRIRKLLLNAHRVPFDGEKIMMEAYHYFVMEAQEQFTTFFQLISSSENLPLVFHCTAGKDRTGFAMALLLKILGVSDEVMMGDYLATNFHRCHETDSLMRRARFFVNGDLLKPLLEARKCYIQHAFQTIEQEFGGLEAYLEEALGLHEQSIHYLREQLLNSKEEEKMLHYSPHTTYQGFSE